MIFIFRIYISFLFLSLIFFAFNKNLAALSKENELVLATTTSVENSGLLNVLLPLFEKETGIRVKVLAVGTGQALRLAGDGNADIVITHSRFAEEKFVMDGHGVKRIPFMRNRFIVVGPKNDPANLKQAKTALDVFKIMADSGVTFISRGDQSGTHQKELELWSAAKVKPKSEHYLETGTGMEATLFMANEKQGYILTDEGTFETIASKISLERLYAGDPILDNIYSVIAVNPNKHKEVNASGAQQFIAFLTHNSFVRNLIETFKHTRDGRPLFYIVPLILKFLPAGFTLYILV